MGQDVRSIRVAWWGGNARHDKMNAVWDGFEAANPDIDVVREYAAYAAYWERIPTQFAGGNAPDLMWFTERQISDYAAAGTTMDVRDLEQYGLDLTGFKPADLELRAFQGKYVRIPMGDTINSVMYNVQMLEKAGISVPEVPWTWDEFFQACVEITKAHDGKNFGTTNGAVSPQGLETTLLQDGKSLFAPDGSRELNFDSADATRWFKAWKDLQDAGGCVPADITSETQTAPFEDTPFASGLAAMGLNNSNQLITYTNAVKARLGEGASLGLAAFPVMGAKPGQIIVGTDYAVNAATKFPEDIARMLNYYFNDPAPAKIMGMELGVPTSGKVLEAIRPTLRPEEAYLADFHAKTADISVPAIPYVQGGLLINTLMPEIALAVAFDSISPEDAGARLVDELSAAIRV
jgi:multiple sugar transport system substrate-binding protein